MLEQRPVVATFLPRACKPVKVYQSGPDLDKNSLHFYNIDVEIQNKVLIITFGGNFFLLLKK